jgi:hypothetical protein
MDDLHRKISSLVEDEHRLRSGVMDDSSRRELAQLEVSLDQAWDLLRQREARKSASLAPDDAGVRPPNEVEGYLQ